MRYVTVCEDLGMKKVPGCQHKAVLRAMKPGVAWEINDETRDHQVVNVSQKVCGASEYTWNLVWIDGRTVALFEAGGATYGQPISEDSRAKTRVLGGRKALREARRKPATVQGAPEEVAPREVKARAPKVRKPFALLD